MRKKTIAIFYIISIVLGLIGTGLIIGGLAGSTYTTTSSGYATTNQIQSIGNPALLIIGVVLSVVAGILHLISWVGRAGRPGPSATVGLVYLDDSL